mgnify:CR=1 FL=1
MRMFPLSQYDVPISARRLPLPSPNDPCDEPQGNRMTPAMEALNPLIDYTPVSYTHLTLPTILLV